MCFRNFQDGCLMYLHFQSLVNVNLDLMVYGKGVMTNVNGALH